MRKFRNDHRLVFIALLATTLLVLGACSKMCNSGYEGSRCNVLQTTKFTGRWAAVDTPGNLMYVDTITQGAFSDIVLSSSFSAHHFIHSINVAVHNDSLLTIPYQQPDNDSNFVQGSGIMSLDHQNITISYQLIMGPDSNKTIIQYGGNWIKQN